MKSSSIQAQNVNGIALKPRAADASYLLWPRLPSLFPVSFPGVKTSHDDFVVDIDREKLVTRMQDYFNPALSHDEIRHRYPQAMTSTKRFPAEAVRDQLLERGFKPEYIVRYCYRPFDVRWLYWEPETKLLDEKREDYFPHVGEGNVWLSAGQRNRKEDFYQPQFTRVLADYHIVESNVGMFPLYLRESLLGQATRKPNLSEMASGYLGRLGATPEDLFYHALAVLHAPAYRRENAGALRQDWPRVPLPATRAALEASAALGRQVAALLDTERGVPGVTEGQIRPELKEVAVFTLPKGKALDEETDFAVTAGWGHAGKEGVVMPGKGKVVEREGVLDIYLNETACWRNVPVAVWEYTLGGYQVIKKWLSYREKKLLGRSLTLDEVKEFTHIVRRIAALVSLQPELDQNYAAVKAVSVSEERSENGTRPD